MNSNKQSFESLWGRHLEPKAKAHGVRDGDLSRVRTAVKNLLVTAGWAGQDGDVSFSSIKDFNACLSAATQTIDRVSPPLAAGAKLTAKMLSGSVPTRTQMLSGSAQPLTAAPTWTPVELESAQREPGMQTTMTSFSPMLAKVGDRCPRCSGSMQPVALVNDKAALYCNRDRVVLPLPSDQTLRDPA